MTSQSAIIVSIIILISIASIILINYSLKTNYEIVNKNAKREEDEIKLRVQKKCKRCFKIKIHETE